MLCGYQWEACPFLSRSRGRVDWGKGVEGRWRRKWEEKREGNFDLDVKLID